jgi:hypothetical protein
MIITAVVVSVAVLLIGPTINQLIRDRGRSKY